MMLNKLKITSVIASCAKAWTLEFFTSRHQSQHNSFTSTVAPMMAIEGIVSSTSLWSEDVNRCMDSMATWINEVIMITANNSTPSGSSRRRPVGYMYGSCLIIIFVVVHTITVLRKSSTPSTKLAKTESELVIVITTTFPASSKILATRLT